MTYFVNKSSVEVAWRCSVMRVILSALFVTFPVTELSAQWGEEETGVPVISETIDPHSCSIGAVRGLSPSGRLSVRSGPQESYLRLGRLSNGDRVYVCNQNGRWLGIVYSRPNTVCHRTGSWAPNLPSNCRSGWIHQHWVEILTG